MNFPSRYPLLTISHILTHDRSIVHHLHARLTTHRVSLFIEIPINIDRESRRGTIQSGSPSSNIFVPDAKTKKEKERERGKEKENEAYHEAIVTPVDSVTTTRLRVQAVDKQPSSRTFYLRGDRRLTLPETLASSSDKVTNVVGQTILIVVPAIASVHIFRVECEISIVGASSWPAEKAGV